MWWLCVLCRPDYGMVAQALAAGLQSVMKEYMVQVSNDFSPIRLHPHHLVSLLALMRPAAAAAAVGSCMQVAQLEHKWRQRSLSLTKMWFLLQPSMRTLEILDKLCHTVRHPCLPLLSPSTHTCRPTASAHAHVRW